MTVIRLTCHRPLPSPWTVGQEQWKLELGATPAINGREVDAADEVRRITGHGVDFALDTTGLPALIGRAVSSLRQRGTAAILGASAPDAIIALGANLMQAVGR